MADQKLSELTAATSPVAGDVPLYGVQSASSVAVTVRQVRAVPAPCPPSAGLVGLIL